MNHNRIPSLTDLSQLESPSVIMAIGVPGSGKSYLMDRVGEIMELPVLSSDEIREELSGDANDQSVSKQAWDVLYHRAKQRITENKSVIIDGTHTVVEYRRRDIARYKNFGAKAVVGLQIVAPMDTILERNSSRDRVVPESVIYRMNSNLGVTPPSVDDGFDFVIKLYNE